MEETICNVEQGKLRGQKLKDIQGGEFLGFRGVPYAKPPLGSLRFKAPEESEKWDGIRDATKEGDACLQIQANITSEGTQTVTLGSEDCLYLNIFTHQLLQDDDLLKPVMVFIPGGAFVSGSGSGFMFGPELLMTEDIVLVTINYRLGALGFLAFDDSGNAGLKDQIQALKWIQKNIKQFSGDSKNVTIFGESAGGASVHFLVLSPLTKGLFNKAIIQSGCVLNCWAYGENNFRLLAKELGCSENDENKIFGFLQGVPALKLVEAQRKFGDWLDSVKKRPFSPSIEDALKTLLSGNYNQVPIIIGYTSVEGMLLEASNVFDITFNTKEFVPYFLGYKESDPKFQEVNKKICKFYFGTEDADANNKTALYNVITDNLCLRGIHKSVQIHAKTSKHPVYYYRMSLDTNLNMTKSLINAKNIKGACHGDDLGYLFKNTFLPWAPGEAETIGYKRFVKMWTNFAKSGKPIPTRDSLLNSEWKPVTEQELNFLDIGNELVPGMNPDIDRMEFWDEIFKDHPGY